jgi:hypothetical protein
MKRYAKVEDDVIINIEVFKDDDETPQGFVDITNVRCNIGDPVVNGSPVPCPSKWHTLEGLTWVITSENQALKDAFDVETQRISEIEVEKTSAGFRRITVQQAHNKIDEIFDAVTNMAELREATRSALKKIVPFIIN